MRCTRPRTTPTHSFSMSATPMKMPSRHTERQSTWPRSAASSAVCWTGGRKSPSWIQSQGSDTVVLGLFNILLVSMSGRLPPRRKECQVRQGFFCGMPHHTLVNSVSLAPWRRIVPSRFSQRRPAAAIYLAQDHWISGAFVGDGHNHGEDVAAGNRMRLALALAITAIFLVVEA